jgi:asparaginyl-tRNA synthetase
MFIKNISQHVGEEVEVKAWVYNKRSSGSLAFLELRDGTGFVQAVVAKDNVGESAWANTEKTSQESSVSL